MLDVCARPVSRASGPGTRARRFPRRRFPGRRTRRGPTRGSGRTAANGASSWFICSHFAGSGKTHHGFDSFEGLSEPAPLDGGYWRQGDCSTSEAAARATLAEFPVQLYKGWIPDRFGEVADRRFCFVHVDVNLYDPARDSVEFFFPRMVPGGIMLFDDYGSGKASPGAPRAIDDFMADRPEPVIHAPSAQAFLIKR